MKRNVKKMNHLNKTDIKNRKKGQKKEKNSEM